MLSKLWEFVALIWNFIKKPFINYQNTKLMKMEEPMDIEDTATAFSLTDFSHEVLVEIFSRLNDTSLLSWAGVSRRFRAIAKEAFGRKYNGATDANFYHVKVLSVNEIGDENQYRPFFRTFGPNIGAMKIEFIGGNGRTVTNHWVCNAMEEFYTSLKMLKVTGGGDITRLLLQHSMLTYFSTDASRSLDWTGNSYPNLLHFEFMPSRFDPLSSEQLNRFFHENRQLIQLRVYNFDELNILDLLSDKMTHLERLEFNWCDEYSSSVSSVALDNLKSIALHSLYSQSLDKAVPFLCTLKKLTDVKIYGISEAEHVHQIFRCLPDLTKLHLKGRSCGFEAFNMLPHIISADTKLIKLVLGVNEHRWKRPEPLRLSQDFIEIMAELTQRNGGLKIVVKSELEELVIHRGQLRRGNSIIYWYGQNRVANQPQMNLLNLKTPCLEKIIALLHSKSQCALYNTCTQMQKVVKDYADLFYSSRLFYATGNDSEEVFRCLGEHIKRISVDYDCDIELEEINDYCPNLAELIIWDNENCLARFGDFMEMDWPKVEKLIILSQNPISYEALRSFECPKLIHLEVEKLDTGNYPVLEVNALKGHANVYRHLKMLKFGCFNENVLKFLSTLDKSTCQQIEVLSLDSMHDRTWKERDDDERVPLISQLISVVSKCRNLKTLVLLIPAVSELFTKYMFENCTRLERFEFCLRWYVDEAIFEHMKRNCEQLRNVRMVLSRDDYSHNLMPLEELKKLLPKAEIQLIYQNSSIASMG